MTLNMLFLVFAHVLHISENFDTSMWSCMAIFWSLSNPAFFGGWESDFKLMKSSVKFLVFVLHSRFFHNFKCFEISFVGLSQHFLNVSVLLISVWCLEDSLVT